MDSRPTRLDGGLKSSAPLPMPTSSSSSLSTSGLGLGSLHGSSEEMSETSDYQRSTPSPRDQDDDLFIIQKKQNVSSFQVTFFSTYRFGY